MHCGTGPAFNPADCDLCTLETRRLPAESHPVARRSRRYRDRARQAGEQRLVGALVQRQDRRSAAPCRHGQPAAHRPQRPHRPTSTPPLCSVESSGLPPAHPGGCTHSTGILPGCLEFSQPASSDRSVPIAASTALRIVALMRHSRASQVNRAVEPGANSSPIRRPW